MVFVPMKKQSAVHVYGSTWSVDHDGRRITETLGDARPAFYFGEIYNSLLSAWETEEVEHGDVRDYEVEALPENIRIPIRTPLPGARSTSDKHPPSRAWVLRADDLLNRGLRIETCRITKVAFKKSPANLQGLCDIVASWVWLESDSVIRAGVDYDETGRISSDTEVQVSLDGKTFESLPSAKVFFSETEAREAAREFAVRLHIAADFEANSALPTAAQDLGAAA